MEIKLQKLESMFIGGILTAISFVVILWIKTEPLYAMAVFGFTSGFWIVFIILGELIKSGTRKHEDKKINK